jgi:hypothetical protein
MNSPDSTPLELLDHSWVHEVLEPEQLSSGKPQYGRRQLGPTTLLLLWVLRLYVLLMILLIAYQVWNAFYAKA